jgi:uncharacterized protein YbjT (DUF2867 family)
VAISDRRSRRAQGEIVDLVIGASGRLGRRVVEGLLDQGRAVRAVSRDPAARLTAAAARGAETLRVDLRDPHSVEQAVRGVDRIVLAAQGLFPPSRSNTIAAVEQEGHRRVVDAAAREGVEHLVFASLAGADRGTPVQHLRAKHETEAHLRDCGVPHTSVRFASLFTEFHCLVLLAEPLRDGRTVRFFGPARDPVRWLSAQDAADYVLYALDQPATGSTPVVAGPEAMSRVEALEVAEAVLGRTAKRAHLPLPVMRAVKAVTPRLHPGTHGLLDLAIAESTVPDHPTWAPHPAMIDWTGRRTVRDVVEEWAGQQALPLP